MPSPSPWLLVSGAGMVMVALAAAALAVRSDRSLWKPLLIGAIAWIVAVALKIAWALPTNALVRAGLSHLVGTAIGDPLYWLYIGLLTGVFENGFAALMVARTSLRTAAWRPALAFGIGFGAVEALALGAVGLLGTAAYLAFHDILPPDTRAQVARQFAGREAFVPLVLPIVERILTLSVHAFASVAVVYGYRSGRPMRWFLVAFVYKTAVDGVAAWALLVLKARESVTALAWTEALMVPFAIVGLAGLIVLHRRMTRVPGAEAAPC